MEFHRHQLRLSDQLVLKDGPKPELHVIRAQGRGTRVEISAGWTSVCWAVRGRLRLEASGCEWELVSGQAQVWRDDALQCRGDAHHGWIVLTGPARAWSACLQSRESHGMHELFLWQGRIRRETAHLLACVAREGGDRTPEYSSTLIAALCGSLSELQTELRARLARCSGRTHARRQQTLMRLLRVRHAIRHGADHHLDLASLARTANYSPFHLIRIHRMVFDETPFEYVARLREERAWRMVSSTGMPICEITEILGFESQSAFCRAFKNAFGTTASEVRRGIGTFGARAA